MVDYSRFDKIAALLSSSDDEEEYSHERNYDDLLSDKFNVSIHKNGNQSTSKPDDDTKHSEHTNPYLDDSLFTAQQQFNPHANKEYIAQHSIQNEEDIASMGNTYGFQVHDDVEDDDLDQIANAADEAFFERHYSEIAPIFVASTRMYQEHKAMYSDELKAMATASETISLPHSVRSEYQITHRINEYSHCIPMDTLRLIFEFSINPNDPVPNGNWDQKDQYDANQDPRRFPLRLLMVCKNWRLCIMKNDQFWSPVIEWLVRGGKERGMSWKKLVTVPEKYLRQFCTWYCVDKFTTSEREEYLRILKENGCLENEDGDSDGADWGLGGGTNGFDEDMEYNTNAFLLIQCLRVCVNTYSVSLSGLICDDLFYAMGTFCKSLRRLDMQYVRMGNGDWFRHLVKEGSGCMDTLFEVDCGRSYWCDDTVLRYLGKLRNLQSVLMDRLYSVTARGLMYLFEGEKECQMRNIHLTRGMRWANDTDEFMKLMIQNGKKMVQLDFQECEGFHDGMLELLEDTEALPELRALNVMYTGCSQEAVDRLQKKRPDGEWGQ